MALFLDTNESAGGSLDSAVGRAKQQRAEPSDDIKAEGSHPQTHSEGGKGGESDTTARATVRRKAVDSIEDRDEEDHRASRLLSGDEQDEPF